MNGSKSTTSPLHNRSQTPKKRREASPSPQMGRILPSEGYKTRRSPSSGTRKSRISRSPHARNDERGPTSEVNRSRSGQSQDFGKGKRARSPHGAQRKNWSPSPGARIHRMSPSPDARKDRKAAVHENKGARGRTPSPEKRFPPAEARNGRPTSPKRDQIQMKLLSMAGVPAQTDQKPTRGTKRPASPPRSRGRGGYETGGGREGRGGYGAGEGGRGGSDNANLEPLARRSPVRREVERDNRRADKSGAEVDPTFLQFLKGEQWMNRPPPPVPGVRGGRRSRSRSFEARSGPRYSSGENRQERRLSPDRFSSPPSKRRRVVMGEDRRGLDGEVEDGEIIISKQDKKPRKDKKDKKRKKKKKKVSSSSDSDSDSSEEEAKKKKKKIKKDKKKKKKKPIEDCEAELRASIAEVEEERKRREEERKKKAPMTKEEWEKKQVNH